jgi:hypothetical protein
MFAFWLASVEILKEIYRYRQYPYLLSRRLLRNQTMKTTPSRYILAVEILIIILFHAVKIKQTDKHPSEMAFTPDSKTIPLNKPAVENRTSLEYMLVNLVK